MSTSPSPQRAGITVTDINHRILAHIQEARRHPEWTAWWGCWLVNGWVIFVASPTAPIIAEEVGLEGFCWYETPINPAWPRIDRHYMPDLARQLATLATLLHETHEPSDWRYPR